MSDDMLQTIISVIGTILGTILGWSLNCLYEQKVRKVKLCYSLQPVVNQDEVVEHELRTKYSESDYCIEIYNVGNTPYLIDRFSLVYKKIIIVDCFITEKKAIMPYESHTYHLNEQEYDSILYHCKESKIKKCKVFANDVGGKRCIGEIDFLLPYIRLN